MHLLTYCTHDKEFVTNVVYKIWFPTNVHKGNALGDVHKSRRMERVIS